jgi:L-asparaginase
MRRKRVCIIYTGGTIGMVATEDGYASKRGVFADDLEKIRDMTSGKMPDWDIIEFDPLLDSSNINHKQWNEIASAIESVYDDYDGFVVLHGTDTMAYTASALSFMFDGLDKPVVFTGSQLPLGEIRSDAADNIITSMLIAADGVVNEVSIYFNGTLLRGNRSTKMSADGLISFASPNYPELARAGIDIQYSGNASKVLSSGSDRLRVRMIKDFSIGVIKLYPGIDFNLFKPLAEAGIDGLILESFGTGNISSEDKVLPPIIAEAIFHGTSVVICTQCPQGTVRLGAYETGSLLARAGAICGYNMTTEAAVTKLAYLLSIGVSKDEIRTLMEQDLRGELNH